VIETDRLLLRRPAAHDAEAVAEAMADEEVMRFIGLGTTSTLEESRAHVEWMQRAWSEDGFGAFIVVRKADAATLGHVGLFAWDPTTWRPGIRREIGDAEIELGWMLARDAWGRGYASEAAAERSSPTPPDLADPPAERPFDESRNEDRRAPRNQGHDLPRRPHRSLDLLEQVRSTPGSGWRTRFP
jgi:hypothetical protein